LSRLGAEVYAISADPAERLSDLQESLGAGVTLLSDDGGGALDAFSMVDPSPFPPRRVARSGTFLIDPDGRVREALLPGSYRARPDADRIVELLR